MKLKILRFILGALGYHHAAATQVLLKFSVLSHTLLNKVDTYAPQVHLRYAQSHKHKYKYSWGPQSGSLVGVLTQGPQSGSSVGVLSWGPQLGFSVGVLSQGPQSWSSVVVLSWSPQSESSVRVLNRSSHQKPPPRVLLNFFWHFSPIGVLSRDLSRSRHHRSFIIFF